MKRASEGEFGRALRDVDLRMFVYRPSDARAGASITQARPCDWMAWHVQDLVVHSTWFECKDTDAVDAFPFSDLRAGQLLGIAEAHRIGIPYWLAVYWRRHKAWTISDASAVLLWRKEPPVLQREGEPFELPTSIPRALLMSRFGTDSSKANLPATLKAVLLGEVG